VQEDKYLKGKRNMSENIIIFPIAKLPSPDVTPEQYKGAVEHVKKKQIEHDVEDISSSIIAHLMSLGYNITELEHQKEVFLLIESLVSLLYKTKDMEHYLQKFNPIIDLSFSSDFLSNTDQVTTTSANTDTEND
jgi:hypothetical protein